jgi:hypothetical protein
VLEQKEYALEGLIVVKGESALAHQKLEQSTMFACLFRRVSSLLLINQKKIMQEIQTIIVNLVTFVWGTQHALAIDVLAQPDCFFKKVNAFHLKEPCQMKPVIQ